MAMCASLKGPGASCDRQYEYGDSVFPVLRTKSAAEPPPRYSMTIHSLTPLTKLVLYAVMYGLWHVLSKAISAWISASSSELSSRSICARRGERGGQKGE